jgi:hypothetical protein
MSEEKSIASIRLALKLKGHYTWIEPNVLHELGEFGEWSLFLHMDKTSEIIFYAGKEENKYRQMFS